MSERPPRSGRRAWCCLAGFLVCVGCGDGKDPDPVTPDDCRNNQPASCPSPEPSYVADIAPILLDRCSACHSPGGVEAAHSFETYARVEQQRNGIRIQIDACIMPPADQPQPTVAERRSILAWIVCGALDN